MGQLRRLLLALLVGTAGVLAGVARADTFTVNWDKSNPTGIIPWMPPPSIIEDLELVEPHARAALSSDAAAVAAGNNRFALDIYRQLNSSAKPGSNLLVSPFSISTALAMTYAGARGNTAQQMASVLGFSLPDDRVHSAFGELMRDLDVDREGYDLNVANRLFGQSGYPFKSPFLETTGRDYGAPLESLNFAADPESARQHINGWVEDQTNDKIKDLLPSGSITEETRLVLTNAVYFNGAWKYKFDEQFTKEETFYPAPGKQSLVSMMLQQEKLPYAESSDFQMLELPYAGDDLSMVVILPRERDGLAALEASLTNERLDSALADLRERQINVFLPKFTFDASFKLSDTLKDMGMTDVFDESAADLTGIAESPWEKLVVKEVLHKAFIDVNEEGTEAAAATAVVVVAVSSCVCAPQEPKTFRADHPFLFALRDRHSGSLLFMGRVMNPGESILSDLNGRVPEPSSLLLLLTAVAPIAFVSRCRD